MPQQATSAATTSTAKPRVLIANKFYYPRGGDCICTINLERLLRDKGHETAIFSMNYPENIPSEWAPYFASEVDFGGGAGAKLRAIRRILGMGDVRASFSRLLDDFKPEVVHLNNIHSQLSPVLAQIARKRGIRVVWTLHDYKLICPAYTCLRDGSVCEECFAGPRPVLTHRCMKGSLAASAVAWIEALKWNRPTLVESVDTFICPSAFMKEKMLQGGFPEEKLTVNCNFIDFDKQRLLFKAPVDDRSDYYCYVGRLSPEKGVDTLLEAASRLPYPLKVAGGGPLLDELKARYASSPQIEFLGPLDAAGVSELLSHARFTVIPSVWYENNPLSVIEALCAGTPVLGASIGGIPELIDEGATGLTFTPGDVDAITRAITDACGRRWDYATIRRDALARFSADAHYARLTPAYGM
ncbi:MAG: glycosyltransferase [Candidatus Amulumruptor caecigallinarius]|nr:glycosyltransferase [Candidatus Amulumruptor caecigallinarius]MCM1396636.1 glycosyltransferase [Candidatus Amulumruptor caecigallinarius]MCM1453306.1 glycosyltransferase [bacterium]